MARYATHAVCDPCFGELEPGRVPYRFVEAHRELERCCNCGQQTRSGIYYRAAVDEMPHCSGHHD